MPGDAAKKTLIFNAKRYVQIKDFLGLQFGTIYPSDVDGIIEYRNRAWFIIEIKTQGNILSMGQRIQIERLVDDLRKAGKLSIALVVTHDSKPEDTVMVADCMVSEIRFKGRWRPPERPITCKQAIEELLKHWRLAA